MGCNLIARKRGSQMAFNRFSFSNFNKERVFSFDTSKITGNYTNLQGLFKANGKDFTYQVKGVYVSTSSEYNAESPIVALADTYVNFPQHQLADVKAILADKEAIRAINKGRAGFRIETYSNDYERTCYKAVWCDVKPGDFEDEEEEEEIE